MCRRRRSSNPFPQGLTPAYGKRYGTYTGLGDNVRWDEYQQRPAISDRFSFSLQREVWARTIVDVSYLMNFISRDGYTKNLNMMDPRLSFQYGAQLQAAVPNPFFNYGTVETFPGALRTRATVSRADLLKPYPQYLNLFQDWTNGRKARYHTLELRVQRPFHQGCRCSRVRVRARLAAGVLRQRGRVRRAPGRGSTRRIRAIG